MLNETILDPQDSNLEGYPRLRELTIGAFLIGEATGRGWSGAARRPLSLLSWRSKRLQVALSSIQGGHDGCPVPCRSFAAGSLRTAKAFARAWGTLPAIARLMTANGGAAVERQSCRLARPEHSSLQISIACRNPHASRAPPQPWPCGLTPRQSLMPKSKGIVRLPPHRRNREGRSSGGTYPAFGSAPARMMQPVERAINVSNEEFYILVEWGRFDQAPVNIPTNMSTHERISTPASGVEARPYLEVRSTQQQRL